MGNDVLLQINWKLESEEQHSKDICKLLTLLKLEMILSTLSYVLLPLLLISSAYGYNLDGFLHENEEKKISVPEGEGILLDNQRVWLGKNASDIKSACAVLERVHSNGTADDQYFTWKYIVPCAIIAERYVVTEQAAFTTYEGGPLEEDTPASDVAVLIRENDGEFRLCLAEEILRTEPRYILTTDENDIAIIKLKTPLDFNRNRHNIAPAIVSCDKSDIFSGETPYDFQQKSKELEAGSVNNTEVDEKSGVNLDGFDFGWGWGSGSHSPPQEDLECVYVSWGNTNGTYSDAPSDLYPTYTRVKIYNLNKCRELYSDTGYYIDPYDKKKFCTVSAKDGNGPDCNYDYNGLAYCYFGHGSSKRRLLVGGMTNIQDLCPTNYPNVILRHAFYAELFNRAEFECCDPQSPTGCNCKDGYKNLIKSPYYCPSKNV